MLLYIILNFPRKIRKKALQVNIFVFFKSLIHVLYNRLSHFNREMVFGNPQFYLFHLFYSFFRCHLHAYLFWSWSFPLHTHLPILLVSSICLIYITECIHLILEHHIMPLNYCPKFEKHLRSTFKLSNTSPFSEFKKTIALGLGLWTIINYWLVCEIPWLGLEDVEQKI